MGELVGGMFVEFLVEETNEPVLERVARVQRHHVEAGVGMAGQEQDLIRVPALGCQALDNCGLELVRKGQQVGGDEHELLVALGQQQGFGPD